MAQVTDHVSTAATIQSFRNSMNMKVPVILIVCKYKFRLEQNSAEQYLQLSRTVNVPLKCHISIA